MAKSTARSKRIRLYSVAVAALLTSTTVKSASEKCQISYSTLNRWIAEPAFQKLYNEAKQDVLDSVKNQLRQLGTKAVTTIDVTIDDFSASATERLNASKFVVDRILNFEITDQLAIRISQLEGSGESE